MTRILMLHRVMPDQPTAFGRPSCYRLRGTALTPEEFERLLEAGPFRTLDEVVAALTAGEPPPPGLVLTFDDGYREWVEQVAPRLAERGVCATFFTCQAFRQEAAEPHPVDVFYWLLDHARRARFELRLPDGTLASGTLESDEGKVALVGGELKRLVVGGPRGEVREVLSRLAEALHVEVPGNLVHELYPSERELGALVAAGHRLGGHGVSHRHLTEMEEAEAALEISTSLAWVARLSGVDSAPFAYPDCAWDAATMRRVEQAGARCAVACTSGPVERGADLYCLPREFVSPRHPLVALSSVPPMLERLPAMQPRRVVVVGQGYVGLPLSVALSQAGHQVVGYDTDRERVRRLEEARVPEAPEGLREVLASGRYRPTHEAGPLGEAEVVIVCVPTPLDAAGRADASGVLEVARLLAARASSEALIVLESTVAPGFVEGPFAQALGAGRRVAYAPERMDPGPGRLPLQAIPRLVAGLSEEAAGEAAALYRSLGVPVQVVPVAVAAWAKLLENTYRLVNVALVGELATACAAAGVDVDAVIRAAATKPFGFTAFHPGPGAGGHCVPVDPVYLVDYLAERGIRLPLVSAALEANTERSRAVARAITARMPADRPGRVLLVGVTYKADVADTRMTAARPIRELLRALGHEVWLHDPLVQGLDGQPCVPLSEETVREVDAIALLVAHRGLDLGLIVSAGRPVLDVCGALAGLGGGQVFRV